MNRLRMCVALPAMRGWFALPFSLFLLFWMASSGLRLPAQALWTAYGPPGGDARCFASVPGEPNHLYLGTTNSWIYESLDRGASWRRLARLDPLEDLVVDSILVDAAHPAVLFAGGWKADKRDGGLWVSRDAGRHWSAVESLRGQSIFSLAQAPSRPSMLYAGTWEGVYRSSDGGASWMPISPAGSKEIHEIESLAIDPSDPKVIYVGTWHLPWKTSDGGTRWHNIKKGLIDDSDVFSIVIDPENPRTVYLSACTGIYKSESAGELFRKVQGIPSTARRTRVLKQDPSDRNVVYAGTTEGLYKTVDGGKSFQPMTGPDVVVNGIYVDPEDSNHVLLAIDRGGVLASTDGGSSFTASNEGFSGRKVEALLADGQQPGHLYAGVVNDKNFGGVFTSPDGGRSWSQLSDGLEGRDVFILAQSPEGALLAGTSHGIFALDADAEGEKPRWQPRNQIVNRIVKTETETHYGKHVNVEKETKAAAVVLSSRVNALDLKGDAWMASTTMGLLTSRDQGESWQGGPVMGSGSYLSVTARKSTMVAARADGVVVSEDAGATWMPMRIPTMLTRIHCVVFSGDGTLWLGAREGVYFTRDMGKTWLWIERLPFRDVDDLFYDAGLGKVLASSEESEEVYAIDPKTLKWQWWRTGYRIELVRAAGGRVLAASLHDGVLAESQSGVAVTAQR